MEKQKKKTTASLPFSAASAFAVWCLGFHQQAPLREGLIQLALDLSDGGREVGDASWKDFSGKEVWLLFGKQKKCLKRKILLEYEVFFLFFWGFLVFV